MGSSTLQWPDFHFMWLCCSSINCDATKHPRTSAHRPCRGPHNVARVSAKMSHLEIIAIYHFFSNTYSKCIV